jgi:hypothetical protein
VVESGKRQEKREGKERRAAVTYEVRRQPAWSELCSFAVGVN